MDEQVEMVDVKDDEEDRVVEWEIGLPNADDLTPLTQLLITPELASAFSITPEPCRTIIDVNRASQTTISRIQKQNQAAHNTLVKSYGDETSGGCDDDEHDNELKIDKSEKRKQALETTEGGNSGFQTDNSNDDQSAVAPTLKRARLVWTPQLHKRFVEVVGHLGIKNAVPKTIMQLMNVEGLTRENVASHLQKYRLYLKRMHGFSNEGPSPSDHLFASTPVPPSLNEQFRAPPPPPVPVPVPVPIPMPYGHHPMIPMSIQPYHGFHPHHYNMYMEQQRDWSGNRFGSIVSHHHHSK